MTHRTAVGLETYDLHPECHMTHRTAVGLETYDLHPECHMTHTTVVGLETYKLHSEGLVENLYISSCILYQATDTSVFYLKKCQHNVFPVSKIY
jgi:hypothetical protein